MREIHKERAGTASAPVGASQGGALPRIGRGQSVIPGTSSIGSPTIKRERERERGLGSCVKRSRVK